MLILKALINFLVLLPTLVAYSAHLSLLILVFFLPMLVAKFGNQKGGLYQLLGILASFLLGGICIRVGYWFAIEGFTAWELAFHQVMYPILGWLYMVVGGLTVVVGIWVTFKRDLLNNL